MPSTEPPQAAQTSETPSGFFNSAFMEIENQIESYFDFPAGDPKASGPEQTEATSFRSPRLTPIASPALRPSTPSAWRTLRGSPGPEPSFAPGLSLNPPREQPSTGGIAPLKINSFPGGQPSPPDSSGSSPEKYARPGDISPLDSLISNLPASDHSRTVHGQVTPPDDFTKSPRLSHMAPSSLVLPMCLISPERSPATSPRLSISSSEPQHRAKAATDTGVKRRRASSASSSRAKMRGKTSSEEVGEAPEVREAKRQRFLERNRVAASKCRQKKKAWMQDLENDAREAQNMSKQLRACVGVLKEEVLQLKNELLKHNTCECVPIRQYLSNEAMRLADGALGRGGTGGRGSVVDGFPFPPADPDCKIHPALQAGGGFDLEYIDNSEPIMT
jgi:hypothetical protein